MFKLFAIFIFAFCCHAFPRYQRLRRQAEEVSTTECKNTYDQCAEWKGQGMCGSDQYKDYMATVCPVTCEFCKESHVRDEIDTPDDDYEMRETAENEEQGDENEQENNEEDENGSGSGSNEESESESESGSGSGKADEGEDDAKKAEKNKEEEPTEPSEETSNPSENNLTENKDENKEAEPTEQKPAEKEEGSGQSESKEEDEENTEDEEDDAKAVQPSKQAKQNQAKGSVTLLLRQNFKAEFQNPDSASYKMLAGNVERDFKKALHATLTDISFSEGSIEGNPRQTGKTKITFNFEDGNDQKLMKKLTKMVDGQQNINGLSVYGGSLEFDE